MKYGPLIGRREIGNVTFMKFDEIIVVIDGAKHRHMPRPERTAGERREGGKKKKVLCPK